MKPYWMYCVFNVYCLVYSNKSCVIANMSIVHHTFLFVGIDSSCLKTKEGLFSKRPTGFFFLSLLYFNFHLLL